MTGHPYPATVLVVDLRGFSRLTNPEQIAARRQLYTLLAEAVAASGLDWELCTHEDRGDGVLLIVPVEVPKVVLLDSVLTELAVRIEAAPRLGSGWTMRVRVAMHAGEVHSDENGFVGSDVNHAFRLLDSAVLREALSTTQRRCAVLVSDVLYQGIVRHGYGELNPDAFHHAVVHTKEMTTAAWLFVPGDSETARAVAGRRAEPDAAVSAGIHISGDVTMREANVAGRDLHVGDDVHGDKVGRDLVKIEKLTVHQQVRRYSAKHPFVAALVVVLLVALLGVGGYVAYAAFGERSPATADTSNDVTGQAEGVTAPPPSGTRSPSEQPAQKLQDPGILVGSWESSDSVSKTFTGNGGSCEGFFYSNGQELDIGGPMTCVLSSRPDADGRFTLKVTQEPNRASYKVIFESVDTVAVYSSAGALIYRLSRF